MESLLFFQLQLCSLLLSENRGARWGKICTKKLISRCVGQSSRILPGLLPNRPRVIERWVDNKGCPWLPWERETETFGWPPASLNTLFLFLGLFLRIFWLTTRLFKHSLSLSQAFSGQLLFPPDEHRAWQLAQIAPEDKKSSDRNAVLECRFYARWHFSARVNLRKLSAQDLPCVYLLSSKSLNWC